jgi:ATP-dependent exoDNAse (exonuclease V) beta subunit
LHDCREWTITGVHPEEVAALQDLVILLGEALAVYDELLSRRRALDFIGLEHAALKLLDGDDPAEVLLRLDYRLKHLLVDEFQDTSQGQMTLLCLLVSGWEAGDGRTLTVVGDPKQSIYGWRQARVRLFLESRKGLPCPGSRFPLEPLLLTSNFRSSRTLIDWANEVFGKTVMAGASSHERVEFHAATPGPEATAGEAPYLALFLESGADNPRDLEARWLAGQLAQAAANAAPDEKVGVLLFARTHLRVYLQALHEAGLSVKVREGLKLADSLVVRHLHNLTRALVRPQDDLAWAAVPRGPWTPQPLEVLARIAGIPGEGWLEKFRKFAAMEGCPPRLGGFLDSLLLAREQVGRRPLAEVVQDLLDSGGAWPGVAAWEGPGGVANARAYLNLLAEAPWAQPEETLARADFSLQDAYQPPDPRAVDSPVEILTVHLAKGLEYDQVFIPYLDWQPLQKDEYPPFLLEEIPKTGLHGLALARAYIQEGQSSFYRLLNQLRKKRILEEARRVFYVAATRARRRLTLSGVIKQDSKGAVKVSGDSPLGWLWRHYRRPEAAPGPFIWANPGIRGEVYTQVSPATAGAQPGVELPPAWDFTPEDAPYRVEYPSRMAQEVGEGEPGRAREAAETDTARIRGRVIHRLLDTLAMGKDLPPAEGVAAALRQEGLAPEAASGLAQEILAETAACRRDPVLRRLLDPNLPEAASEWLLESQPQPGVIRRGIMDRLAFDGRDWWLLDYKTSRPGREEDWDAFMAQEKEKYAPQIRAYREMAASAKNIRPEAIRLGIYFTAIQKMVELE